jgi:hypothetical protein
MSCSFDFSVDAEPFIPKDVNQGKGVMQEKIDSLQGELENERLTNMKLMKLYKGQCSLVQGGSEERLKTLTQENERLNKEIRKVNMQLLKERMDKRNLQEKMQQKQNAIDNLNDDLIYKDGRYDALQRRFDGLNREFTRYKERNDSEVWMGRCLKLDFIFKKIKQIGALPEDHGAWVWDMIDDIEFPDGPSSPSVFLSVPNSIRNRFLPSATDAGINFQDNEISIIDELSREAEEFNANLSENFRRSLDENPEIVISRIRIIQSRFREHIRPNLEKRIQAATKIQSIWRGFCGRGIITYKGTLKYDTSLMKYKLTPDKTIKSTYQIVPEHMRRAIRINLANTSKEIIHYKWLKIRPNTLECDGFGTEYSIKPGESVSVRAYIGHWFSFAHESDECEQFFRVMRNSFLGNLGRDIWTRPSAVFDLNTKLTITRDHYDEWERGVLGSHAVRILNTEHLNVHNNPIAPDEGDDESNEEDDARLMLAIQLSLDNQ